VSEQAQAQEKVGAVTEEAKQNRAPLIAGAVVLLLIAIWLIRR
jgi:hypothetical protein